MVRELVAQLNASRNDLRMKVATGGHGLEMKWELTMKLGTLNRACASLPEAVEAGVVTPFALHLRLRELLGELPWLFFRKRPPLSASHTTMTIHCVRSRNWTRKSAT